MTGVRAGAIVGFGNVAANGHLPGWHARSDFRITAIAEPDAQRRALAMQLAPHAQCYSSIDALFENTPVEFVDIATPPAGHMPAIVAAARHGVHVLCEKPLVTSIDEYRAMRSATGAEDIVLHTVHNWKYSEPFSVVHALLADGAIGALRRMTFDTERDGCAVSTADNWRIRPSIAGGGILVDHGWHVFYLLSILAGTRPRRIRARLDKQRYTTAEVEDTAHCVIDFPGCTAEVRLTWAATHRRTRWRFEGTDGELLVDDDHVVLATRGRREVRPLHTALSSGSHHPDWFGQVVDSFRLELDEPMRRGTNLREAELCLLMLHLAYTSDAEGSRPLDVPDRILSAEEGDPAGVHRTDSATHSG